MAQGTGETDGGSTRVADGEGLRRSVCSRRSMSKAIRAGPSVGKHGFTAQVPAKLTKERVIAHAANISHVANVMVYCLYGIGRV